MLKSVNLASPSEYFFEKKIPAVNGDFTAAFF